MLIKSFRVAIIEPVGGHGGMDYYDFGLCGGLAQAGLNVHLYTCDETVNPTSARFTIKKWYCGIYGELHILLRGIRFFLSTLRVFWDVVHQHIPLVHLHFFDVGVLQLSLIFLAKILRRKVIVTVHDVEGFVEGKGSLLMAKYAYRWVDGLIVHNHFSKSELISSIKVPEDRISVIPHGNYRHIYPNLIERNPARERLGLDGNEKILLFFGQIKGVKRLDLLLTAFATVLKAQTNTRLVIAGKVVDVPYSYYQGQIDGLGITENCTSVIRYIDNEEVPLFYASADLVVLPYERIYQSGVLLMAMSFARAVVVSDIPGMLEIVSEGQTGYVFRNGDVSSLATALLNGLVSDVEREKIALRGLRLMDDAYAWPLIAKMTADLYVDVVHGSAK